MMQFLGGLPYVDKSFNAAESPRLERLSYQECADMAAADFKKASELLPIDWDNTTAGKKTLGKNELRINKITALAYLGKNYLWAASPLMQHGAQTGGTKTYDYSAEYAGLAADAFGQIISLVQSVGPSMNSPSSNMTTSMTTRRKRALTTATANFSSRSDAAGFSPAARRQFSAVHPQVGHSPATTTPVRSASTSFAPRTTISIRPLPTT